jgi:hypothetical protein
VLDRYDDGSFGGIAPAGLGRWDQSGASKAID